MISYAEFFIVLGALAFGFVLLGSYAVGKAHRFGYELGRKHGLEDGQRMGLVNSARLTELQGDFVPPAFGRKGG
jgi:hypothetical protein